MSGDADISVPAAMIGDRARARILMALTDGRALAASVLATEAGVAASTASEHLAKLTDAGLLRAERHGRHRYYRLVDARVVRAIETLAELAPPAPIRSLREGTRAHAIRHARLCYDHLGGRLAVALMAALIHAGALTGGDGHHHPADARRDRLSAPGHDVDYRLTDHGATILGDFGIDTDALRAGRRPVIRYCLDWSEQRHHLAGALGAALTARLLEQDWLRPRPRDRGLTLTPAGTIGLQTAFGVNMAALAR